MHFSAVLNVSIQRSEILCVIFQSIICRYKENNNIFKSELVLILSADIDVRYIVNLKIMIVYVYSDIENTCLFLLDIVYFKYLITRQISMH